MMKRVHQIDKKTKSHRQNIYDIIIKKEEIHFLGHDKYWCKIFFSLCQRVDQRLVWEI